MEVEEEVVSEEVKCMKDEEASEEVTISEAEVNIEAEVISEVEVISLEVAAILEVEVNLEVVVNLEEEAITKIEEILEEEAEVEVDPSLEVEMMMVLKSFNLILIQIRLTVKDLIVEEVEAEVLEETQRAEAEVSEVLNKLRVFLYKFKVNIKFYYINV